MSDRVIAALDSPPSITISRLPLLLIDALEALLCLGTARPIMIPRLTTV